MGHLLASVERKSLVDLVASLIGGTLRYALAELAAAHTWAEGEVAAIGRLTPPGAASTGENAARGWA